MQEKRINMHSKNGLIFFFIKMTEKQVLIAEFGHFYPIFFRINENDD